MRLRPAHYWRRRVRLARPERFAALVCDPSGTITLLSRAPQKALSWLSRFLAFLTTPFKFLGISGWKETGCESEGKGRPVRDAQHSTDGFWTIDVALEQMTIGANPAGLHPPRYLRLEVEPETPAHDVCSKNPIGPATDLIFGGAVVIDTDGPFLEVHPRREFPDRALRRSLSREGISPTASACGPATPGARPRAARRRSRALRNRSGCPAGS